ncbi:YaaL family protein [Salirhabdus salicampi]|uniref:YaaL family protein n=1 Tax=Salirhabdus salicampi TaxID=476102 RepID=UPI0020C583D4|nr:YaaL family protein [Salirhabdus salicampi]MCP8617171.1 YaaL family protein [Salirhabdus salicampi]
MFGKRKFKRKNYDQQLIENIDLFRGRWNQLNDILENSIEPSEKGLFDQKLAKAKYFFLLREARHRHIK